MKFEWDELKRNQNIEKHGLDFVDAIEIFKDPNRIERIDDRKNYIEIRHQTIGMIKKAELIIFIAWTYRLKTIRIISARLAHLKERRLYNEKQNKLG